MNNGQKPVIPTAVWATSSALFVLAFCVVAVIMTRFHGVEVTHPVARILVPLCIGTILAGMTLLIGYVHGDAKRRGMRYVMWTWLAILVPNGLGIILYFVLRDPIPVFCSKCGGAMGPGFAFCPHCGVGVAPACRSCQRVSQPGWSHCAYCGTQL